MGIVTTIVMAAAAVYSAVQQRKGVKEQRKAIRAQQRQADLANARERRGAIRNARVARASIENQAANTGLVGSSAASASMSNVSSRLGENLSFLDQNQQLSRQASVANERAAGYASKAAMGQTVASIAQSVGNSFNGSSG